MRRINSSRRLTNSGGHRPATGSPVASNAHLGPDSQVATVNNTPGSGKPVAGPGPADGVRIDDLLANGQGVGRVNGMVAFVSGALPGEHVSVDIERVKANYLSARATDIRRASPDRVASVCRVFPACGGCQTLHLSYEAQLRWKQSMLAEALARIAGLRDVAVEDTRPSPLIDGTRYRNKVTLVVGSGGRRAEIGFYAARSHRIVPIQECPVLLPRLDRAVRALVELVRKTPALLAGVQHIVMREGAASPGTVICFTTARAQRELPPFVEALRANIPGLTGIINSYDLAGENAVFGKRFTTIWGSPHVREVVAGATFTFGIASFFQINTAVLELIAAHCQESLAGLRRVVDVYSGVGTFAVLLGRRGISGGGVESSRAAVDEAAANAASNGVTSFSFECAPAAEALSGERGRSLLSGADAVMLDPPRRGCEPEVLTGLMDAKVPRVQYLSCDPATLARDAKVLAANGYVLSRVIPFDMFPHTGHVEALAEFHLNG